MLQDAGFIFVALWSSSKTTRMPHFFGSKRQSGPTWTKPAFRPEHTFKLMRCRILLPVKGVCGYTPQCAAVVVEGATVSGFVTGTTAMLALGLILTFSGIGLFCWLIFTLAVYAVPFLVGLSAGMAALHNGAGIFGALIAGIVVGALTLTVGQVAFARVRLILLRAAIAAAFAIPAAIAGHHAALGLSQIGVPSLFWREAFAWVGAIVVGCTAWARMTVLAEPLPLRLDGATAVEPQPLLTAATRER
jgi:hypothetical protein